MTYADLVNAINTYDYVADGIKDHFRPMITPVSNEELYGLFNDIDERTDHRTVAVIHSLLIEKFGRKFYDITTRGIDIGSMLGEIQKGGIRISFDDRFIGSICNYLKRLFRSCDNRSILEPRELYKTLTEGYINHELGYEVYPRFNEMDVFIVERPDQVGTLLSIVSRTYKDDIEDYNMYVMAMIFHIYNLGVLLNRETDNIEHMPIYTVISVAIGRIPLAFIEQIIPPLLLATYIHNSNIFSQLTRVLARLIFGTELDADSENLRIYRYHDLYENMRELSKEIDKLTEDVGKLRYSVPLFPIEALKKLRESYDNSNYFTPQTLREVRERYNELAGGVFKMRSVNVSGTARFNDQAIDVFPLLYKNKQYFVFSDWISIFKGIGDAAINNDSTKMWEWNFNVPVLYRPMLKLYDPHIVSPRDTIITKARDNEYVRYGPSRVTIDPGVEKRIDYRESIAEGVSRNIVRLVFNNVTQGGEILSNPADINEQPNLERRTLEPMFVYKNNRLVPTYDISTDSLQASCDVLVGRNVGIHDTYKIIGSVTSQIILTYGVKPGWDLSANFFKSYFLRGQGSLENKAKGYLNMLYHDDIALWRLLVKFLDVSSTEELHFQITEILLKYMSSLYHREDKPHTAYHASLVDHLGDRSFGSVVVEMRQYDGKLPKIYDYSNINDPKPSKDPNDWDYVDNISLEDRIKWMSWKQYFVMYTQNDDFNECLENGFSSFPLHPRNDIIRNAYENDIVHQKYTMIIECALWYYGVRRYNPANDRFYTLDPYTSFGEGFASVTWSLNGRRLYFNIEQNVTELTQTERYREIINFKSLFYDKEIDIQGLIENITVVVNYSPSYLTKLVEDYGQAVNTDILTEHNTYRLNTLNTTLPARLDQIRDHTELVAPIFDRILKLSEWMMEFITSDDLYNRPGENNDVKLNNVSNKNDKIERLLTFWTGSSAPSMAYALTIYYGKKYVEEPRRADYDSDDEYNAEMERYNRNKQLKNHLFFESHTCTSTIDMRDAADWFYDPETTRNSVENLDQNKKMFFNNLITSLNLGQEGYGFRGGARNRYKYKYEKYKMKLLRLNKIIKRRAR